MRTHIVLSLAAALLVAGIAPAKSPKPTLPATLDYSVGGQPWLRTMAAPHDTANREETYKVFTHILSFDGKGPITKGAGGKFTHHRGLFIGWKDTMVNGVDLDTWHMPNCYQQLVSTSEANGVQTLGITWNDLENKPFITEERTLAAKADGDVRLIDFGSKLTALEHKIELKGDLQHAGMQLRMAQEVADHEDSTSYILPEGAVSGDDDKVTGAWWACVSCVVDGKRYWLVHMSPPSTPGGVPVYSIRKYARFGAFFEPTIEKGEALALHFRIAVSEKELDQKACQALYDAFAAERP